MEYLLIVAIASLVVTAIAKRRGWQSELIVLLLAATVSFVPNFPELSIDPHLLLEIVLPPLLFSSAKNLDRTKFNRLKKSILSLGFVLVIVTAIVVAVIVNAISSQLSFTVCLILGAIVSPPDAVSTVAIGKKMHLPDRVMSILTGESLINDAAALTLFSFALSLHESNSAGFAVQLFFFTTAIGIGVGFAFAQLMKYIRRILKDAALVSVFTMISPFLIYIIAEQAGGSGVLAVVTAGFSLQQSTLRSDYVTRMQEKSLWHAIDTLFETFVFAYIGLNAKNVIMDVANETLIDSFHAVLLAFIVLALVIVTRIIFVKTMYFMNGRLNEMTVNRYEKFRKLFQEANFDTASPYYRFLNDPKRKRRYEQAKRAYEQAKHSIESSKKRGNESNIVAWSGMRGVVTLATAFAIPISYGGGVTIDARTTVQFIALVVTVGTLVLQASTLPYVIKRSLGEKVLLKEEKKDYAKAVKILNASTMNTISKLDLKDDTKETERRIIRAYRALAQQGDIVRTDPESGEEEDIRISDIIHSITENQREDLLAAVDDCIISQDTADSLLTHLDLRQASINTLGI
ncbi:MAG: sodium:proton antiporter [Bifidobacteriaceae bacterium]|jgi:CPA1 family monovalent cation:H+ antiporter|nr:sodium:proton antiporter [Bifidobacteriaceae bacterium]